MSRGDFGKRAFATTAALLMISIVSVAVATLMLLVSADAKRTDRAATTAQLDQLLHAGAVDALASLRQSNSRDAWDLSVLSEVGATVRVRIAPAKDESHRSVRIEATLRSRRAAETIDCVRDGAVWRVESARLEQ